MACTLSSKAAAQAVCLVCSTPLKKRQRKFCSRTCTSAAVVMQLEGFVNTTGLRKPDAIRKRASACSGERHHGWKGGVVTKTCKVCSDPFTVRRAVASRRLFCSQECYWSDLAHRPTVINKDTIRCEICGKPFQAYKSQHRRFCGHRCSGINAAKNTPNKDTSLERIVEAVLLKMNIVFVKQQPIEGVSIPDFYVAEFKLAIFADGAYWHSRADSRRRDAFVNKRLPELGYRVLRLAESVIKSDETLWALVKSKMDQMRTEGESQGRQAMYQQMQESAQQGQPGQPAGGAAA